MRTFEYRLFVKKQQAHLLMQCLKETRLIYNEMLESVKAQYEEKGTFPSKYDLEIAFKGQGAHVPATTVQMLADRLSTSLKRFLAAKQHTIPAVGFPRFKKPNRWHSIQLRQYGKDVYLHEDKKHLLVPKKIGHCLKIKLHRPLEGTPKTVHLVLRADGHWYALIVCETSPPTAHLPAVCPHPDIGIDVGLKSFLTDSEGTTVANPRYYRSSQKTLRRKQRVLCRRQKGSHRRRKAAKNVAKTHLKIARQRRDFHFKTATQYTTRYGRIAVEDLNISGMLKISIWPNPSVMPVGARFSPSLKPKLQMLDIKSCESIRALPARNATSVAKSSRNLSLCVPISVLSVAMWQTVM